ncbi:MAG: putative polyketide hydroxylase [Frankiales bacterium]|jgi:2-polyprenyl-6-methoxyphenol hydroxylase-like FAD-dependent oxidoreductase|nr:putative polyketide hydroxylase [Frankiales bacterium]
MKGKELPVLVIGAGPVGMSAALLLARHGVPSVLIEARQSLGQHPKARGVRLRTMELFRQWGLADELQAQALPAEALRFIYCDSLAGRELGRTPTLDESGGMFSPSRICRVAQDAVEHALSDRLQKEPLVDVRRGTRLIDLLQTEETVEAHVLTADGDPSQHEVISGSYLIAADGVGSTVRRLLEIPVDGAPLLGYWQSIYWYGDISRWTADRPCIQFFTGMRGGKSATVASVDGRERWITMVPHPPSEEPPEPLQTAQAQEIVRGAVGDEAFLPDIVDIATWRLSATVARAWRDRRVFLAGDAAHSFPPTGGFGMNTGIQDVHNLVWKLALVRSGRAQDGLLETYGVERRPVAQGNADWSVANGDRIRRISQALATGDHQQFAALLIDQDEHVNALEQDLGFEYASTAIIPETTPTPPRTATFDPAARSGRRAPHAWIRAKGREISTLDLLEGEFVLFTGAQSSQAWATAAATLPDTMPEVAVYRVGTDIQVGEDFTAVYGLGDTDVVLIRPDGHVAWRPAPGSAESTELEVGLRRITS